MDEVDVFEGLDRLEKEKTVKSYKRKESQKTASRLAQLREKCAELKEKKLQLEEKLKSELILDSEDKIIETVSCVWKSRLENCLSLYRLAGISASRLDAKSMLIRFDTSFEGKFYEPYFLELVKTESMGIRQHTIPAFIPLPQLAQRYLHDNLQTLLRIISDHVVAYVRRREDLKKAQDLLQTRGYIIGEMSSTLAVDITEFHTERDTLASPALNIVLRFDNLLHLTPSSASITALGDENEALEGKTWRKVLTSGPPSETLQNLCPEMGKKSQSDNTISDSE